MMLGEQTRLMAIVNLTPDSFSGDGLSGGIETGIKAAIAAFDGGADIVDLGAESTRPDATPISSEEEQQRLLPVLRGFLNERPKAVVSVDTYHAATARAAAAAGADIVNDVSGLLWDADMAKTVAETKCGLVLMHARGKPGEWRTLPAISPGEVAALVAEGLSERLAAAKTAGIRDEAIALDPGFGFGKMGSENFELLAELSCLQALARPLAIGLSRKSFLGEALRGLVDLGAAPAESRRAATLAANVAAILNGAHILRVHDLQLAREAAAVADSILQASQHGVSSDRQFREGV